MSARYDVAVIGLGAMGAATLYQLAKRGISAIGIDRHAPPHAFGSTHGETRITRQAVGESADYVPLVMRSHAIWRELERVTGRQLFVQCGAIMIGKLTSPAARHGTPSFVRMTVDIAEQFGIAHSLLDRETLARDFPQFVNLDDDDVAYHEPGAGYVDPEACVEAQLTEALRLGATIRTRTPVGELREDRDGVQIETDAGPILADRVVTAAGAWTAGLVGAPFDRLLRVTRQTLYWFEPEQPALFAPERCPVFLREHGEHGSAFYYGFPIPAGGVGVKVATESEDEPIDPLAYRPDNNAAAAPAFHAAQIARTLAGVTPNLLKSRTCLYTSTPDARFIIDDHPAIPRVTVISACSGHGFKHSAAIGELVAEHARGVPLPRIFAI